MPQFTLRGVLLAVAVFCVWLAWLTNSARQQKTACARLKSSGGMPWDYAFIPGALPVWEFAGREPEWLTPFFDIDLVASVTQVRFTLSTNLNCTVVETLRSLPRLDTVEVVDTPIEPNFIASLSQLPRLRRLRVKKTALSDQVIDEISRLHGLEEVSFEECRVNETSLPLLANLTRLERLDLTDTRVSLAAIWRLEELMSDCWITPSTFDRENELIDSRLNDSALTVATGIPTADRADWPSDFIDHLTLQISAIHPDGFLDVSNHSKCAIGHPSAVRRAWQKSFLGKVHVSHVHLNERGWQSVDLDDFADFQCTICEVSPDEEFY
jgi:hypothetical protein